jgi:hypothetical protein
MLSLSQATRRSVLALVHAGLEIQRQCLNGLALGLLEEVTKVNAMADWKTSRRVSRLVVVQAFFAMMVHVLSKSSDAIFVFGNSSLYVSVYALPVRTRSSFYMVKTRVCG